ncbi:MAG: hypothetical protein M3Q85_06545 [Acidobacteriota bacterium]|nr:hypothetical protein [Acidobacteriota bacterium]
MARWGPIGGAMKLSNILLYAGFAAAGTVATAIGLRLVWHAIGLYRIRRAGPRALRAFRHVLWRDPGDVPHLDMIAGPGGPGSAPAPPFRFLEEHATGSQPCVSVRDARHRIWRVKWGEEVRSENVAVRLAWACGYFAETTYFIASGVIEGAKELQRARNCLDDECRFVEARFELEDPAVRKMFEEHSWAWNDNPFVGTRELHGLKILVMLLSNWDTKDRRDVARGSNTAIFEHRISRGRHEARYLITDWGGSMGRWGGNIVTRARWDPAGFVAQTPQFVAGIDQDLVIFGYAGQRTADVSTGIRTTDVAWLYRYLGRITDGQLRAALEASGANDEDNAAFAESLRERILQLGRVCGAAAPAPAAVSPTKTGDESTG